MLTKLTQSNLQTESYWQPDLSMLPYETVWGVHFLHSNLSSVLYDVQCIKSDHHPLTSRAEKKPWICVFQKNVEERWLQINRKTYVRGLFHLCVALHQECSKNARGAINCFWHPKCTKQWVFLCACMNLLTNAQKSAVNNSSKLKKMHELLYVRGPVKIYA